MSEAISLPTGAKAVKFDSTSGTIDVGFYTSYTSVDTTYYAGLYRDHLDNVYKFFKNNSSIPVPTAVYTTLSDLDVGYYLTRPTLTVDGTVNYVNNVQVNNRLLNLDDGETVDSKNSGILTQYDAGSGARYAGLIRKGTDGFYLTKDEKTSDPDSMTFASVDNLQVNKLCANSITHLTKAITLPASNGTLLLTSQLIGGTSNRGGFQSVGDITTTTSLTADTWVILTDNELDAVNLIDVTSPIKGKLKVVTTGNYKISYFVQAIRTIENSLIRMAVTINGSRITAGMGHVANRPTSGYSKFNDCCASTTVALNANDEIQLSIKSNVTTAVAIGNVSCYVAKL